MKRIRLVLLRDLIDENERLRAEAAVHKAHVIAREGEIDELLAAIREVLTLKAPSTDWESMHAHFWRIRTILEKAKPEEEA